MDSRSWVHLERHFPAQSSMARLSQNEALSTPGEVALKTILFLQMGVGMLANIILFFCNVSPALLGLRLWPTQVIFAHMAMANSSILLSTALPHVMVAFGLRNPLSSLGCKLVYYIRLVARSTCLSSTCVLSTYRFLTLVPRTPGWAGLRDRVPKAIGFTCCTCWLFALLWHAHIPLMVAGPQETSNVTDAQGKWLCSFLGPFASVVFLWLVHDAVFIGLMVGTSGSLVLFLHRHHQRLQHIHSPKQHKGRPEARAAHTVLMLVLTFFCCYLGSTVLCSYINPTLASHLLWLEVSTILVVCFPTVCPLLLMLRDPRILLSCS